ncbi:MAG: UDP-N-acetylmuramoyl-tripeptide--D-alanyl-D-alanine ligase [Chloroflexi bacterium]|nr:UDP-N-acetylmuramoyl-tripeptide--D-alanyl-D-alanine ligase [Chloroflexota bacterium]
MFTLAEALAGLGAAPEDLPASLSTVKFTGASNDSRAIQPGQIFVALRGETQDGHDFIGDALGRGATGVLAERTVDLPEGAWVLDLRGKAPAIPSRPFQAPAYFLVTDALKSLQSLAGYWRSKLPVDVVGITGSVGKTSTKEMIASVLSQRFKVLKSEKNLNNEIGLPLTLLRLEPSHQKAVLEIGMYGLGEIALLSSLARPRVGVITNVGPSHLERLGAIERIAQAKVELVEALPPEGYAILNGDDPVVRQMATKTRATVFIYGQESNFDLWASQVESRGLEGIRLCLHYGRESLYLKIPLLGAHSAHTALAATAVGLVMGLTWEEIAGGLSRVPEQLRLIVVPGINGSTLIDDTYNSSPASALAALNLLAELPGRHVAVLGDLLELGTYEDEGHRLVGRRALEVAARLVVVGERGRIIGQEALACGRDPEDVYFASSNQEAIQHLGSMLAPGDVVLLKGSRGMRMEEIVNALRTDGA